MMPGGSMSLGGTDDIVHQVPRSGSFYSSNPGNSSGNAPGSSPVSNNFPNNNNDSRLGATSPRPPGAIGAHRFGSGSATKAEQQQQQARNGSSIPRVSSPLSSLSDNNNAAGAKDVGGSSSSGSSAAAPASAFNVWGVPGGASRFLQHGSTSSSAGRREASAQGSFVTAHSQQASGNDTPASSEVGDTSFLNAHGEFYPGSEAAAAAAAAGGDGKKSEAGASYSDASADNQRAETPNMGGSKTPAASAHQHHALLQSPATNGSSGTPAMSEYGTPRLFLDINSDSPRPPTAGQGEWREDVHATPLARPNASNGLQQLGVGGSAPAAVDRLAIIREKNASQARLAQQQAAAAAAGQGQDGDGSMGDISIGSEFAGLRGQSKSPMRADSGSSGLDSSFDYGSGAFGDVGSGNNNPLNSMTSPLVLTGISGWGQNASAGAGQGAQGGGGSSERGSGFSSGFGRSGTPMLSLPASAFESGAARYGSLAGGLLSPSAATVGGNLNGGGGGNNNNNAPGLNAFSPASPISANAQAQGFGAAAAAAFSNGYGGGGGPRGPNNPGFNSLHAAFGPPSDNDSPFDAQLKQSAIMGDIVERIVRLEIGLKDLQRQVGGISRSVNLLHDRNKQGGSNYGGPPAGFGRAQSPQIGAFPNHARPEGLPLQNANEELRNLTAQLNSLSTSVAHLFQSQQGGGVAGGYGGRGPAIPGERATSPMLPGAGATFGNQQQRLGSGIDSNTRLSPRPYQGSSSRVSWGAGPELGPGGAPRKTSGANRRDSSSVGGYDDNRGYGANGPHGGDSNFVISKWDHLNLHPELLRSILKYGLGPPNKIQQRALPFLLRGNDIIAQAPPTQERIASYVIPTLQLVLSTLREPGVSSNARGPIALMISTTVDQATQAQRMALGLGSPLGVRIHIAAAAGIDIASELQTMSQISPHIVIGTPQKMSELFTQLVAHNALPANDVRLVVLDEVDQLIARNLSDHVSSLLRVLPMPRTSTPGGSKSLMSPAAVPGRSNPWDTATSPGAASAGQGTMDRQTAIFSNTVPQDVLNFAQSIHLRESVRVLVRREASTMLGLSGGTGGGGGGGGGPGAGGGPGSTGGPLSSAGSGTFGAGAGGNSTAGPYSSHQQTGYPPAGMNSAAAGGAGSTPSNALGATPMMNISANPLADPLLSALRGLRQYYLYVAVASNPSPMGGAGSALEMKLDVITDLLEDMDFGQAVIYTGAPGTTEAVTYKLSSKGIEALTLVSRMCEHMGAPADLQCLTSPQHKDMASATRAQILQKFRQPGSAFVSHSNPMAPTRKALVIHDTALSPKEVHQVPLVVFYDLPRSIEEYKEK